MESAIRKLRVQTYQAQLAVCNQVREARSKELENVALAEHQRAALRQRLDEAVYESNSLQFLVDLAERQIKEAEGDAASTNIEH